MAMSSNITSSLINFLTSLSGLDTNYTQGKSPVSSQQSQSGIPFAVKRRPGWAATIAVIALLPVLTALGFWQLQRAEEKTEIQAEYDRREGAGELPVTGTIRNAEELRFYRIRVRGEYEADRQIWLDNRVHNGQVGYHVLTPMRIEGSDTRILVNRGWIHQGQGRGALPAALPPAGVHTIVGVATVPFKGGYKLGPAFPADGNWHARWQFIEMDQYAQAAPYPVQPVMMLLDAGDQPGGLVREWKRLDAGIAVHHGYAFQWFSLAVTLAGIYLFFLFRKPGRAEGTDSDIEA